MSDSTMPYGPGTPLIRQFLVQLAGLGAAARREVCDAYAAIIDTADYIAAETLLGETIERAGRTDARDAMAGPLLQLVRVSPDDSNAAPDGDDALTMLDPIAEPALAALLALLVADLVPATSVDVLYAPFETVMPRTRTT